VLSLVYNLVTIAIAVNFSMVAWYIFDIVTEESAILHCLFCVKRIAMDVVAARSFLAGTI